MPATTWALVATRPPTTTKPEPIWARPQSRPRIPTVDPDSRATRSSERPCRPGGGPTSNGSPTADRSWTGTSVTGPLTATRMIVRAAPNVATTNVIKASRAAPCRATRRPLTEAVGEHGSGTPCGPPSGDPAGQRRRPHARCGSGPRPSRQIGTHVRPEPYGNVWPARCSACRPR